MEAVMQEEHLAAEEMPDENLEQDIKDKMPLDQLLRVVITNHLDKFKTDGGAGGEPKPGSGENEENISFLQKFNTLHSKPLDYKALKSSELYTRVLEALVTEKLKNEKWFSDATDKDHFETVTAIQQIVKDSKFLKQFCHLGGPAVMKQWLQHISEKQMFLEVGDSDTYASTLKFLTSICQKMSNQGEFQEVIIASSLHQPLLSLLGCSDVGVQQAALYCLASLCKWVNFRHVLQTTAVDPLFLVLQEQDLLSKKIACNILRLLCSETEVREQVKSFDGLPILLSLLQSRSLSLKWNVMWILVQLTARDPEVCREVWSLGGVPILLKLLSPKMEDSGREELICSSPVGDSPENDDNPENMKEESKLNVLSTQSAVCMCLSELTTNLTVAQHIRQVNGIFIISQHILPNQESSPVLQQTRHFLQCSASRALRFLFSIERNRPVIRRMFTPEMLEVFIAIGHYKRDTESYQPFLDKLNELTPDGMQAFRSNMQVVNHDVTPMFQVNDYDVLEHIGSGAFGSVYKAKKPNGEMFAMKEIRILHPMFGRTNKERNTSVGQVISEINIVRQQLRHPNIVRYYKVFTENEKLYVVMELIDGVSLAEHISSLKEKRETFPEKEIWHIFVQIILALRYLHKGKRIIHRDLTPNNIMLSERNEITITDFGLARQKHTEFSKMTSMVGTLVYNCPEVIQNMPYGEKADVWSAGCILYQMCTLDPPFTSSNVLALATKIVEGVYKPISDKLYSPKIMTIAHRCLTVNPDDRPDILGVASMMVDVIMEFTDKLQQEQLELEKRMIRDQRFPQQAKFLQMLENVAPASPATSSSGGSSGRFKSEEKQTSVAGSAESRDPSLSSDRLSETSGTTSSDGKSNTGSDNLEKQSTQSSGVNAISIPLKRIVEVSDPVLKVLHQIRKIVYVSQNFSGNDSNSGRTLVVRYKAMLFSPQMTTPLVKSELCKLVNCSCQTVELLNTYPRLIHEAIHELHVQSMKILLEDASEDKPGPRESTSFLSYDQLSNIIENLIRAMGTVPL